MIIIPLLVSWKLPLLRQLGKRKPISIPYWMAKCLALVGDVFSFFPINSSRLEKIVTSDTWSNEKAKRELGWQPMSVLEKLQDYIDILRGMGVNNNQKAF